MEEEEGEHNEDKNQLPAKRRIPFLLLLILYLEPVHLHNKRQSVLDVELGAGFPACGVAT